MTAFDPDRYSRQVRFTPLGVAGQERLAPDAPVALRDQLTMPVFFAREVCAGFTRVRDHHAHVTNFDDGFLDHLDGGKKAVDVVSAKRIIAVRAPPRDVGRDVGASQYVCAEHKLPHGQGS